MDEKLPEFLHFKPGTGPCMVHDWSEADFRAKLVLMLRARHGHGGIDICRECVKRLRVLRTKLENERVG